MKKAILIILAFAISGCAAHYNEEISTDPYGFFSGIWHGIIFIFAIVANIVSWLLSFVGITFLDGIQIIGRPNTGILYYVGFVFGAAAITGGGANSS